MTTTTRNEAFSQAKELANDCGVTFYVHPHAGRFLVTDTPCVDLSACVAVHPDGANEDWKRNNRFGQWVLQKHYQRMGGISLLP